MIPEIIPIISPMVQELITDFEQASDEVLTSNSELTGRSLSNNIRQLGFFAKTSKQDLSELYPVLEYFTESFGNVAKKVSNKNHLPFLR